MNAPNRQQLPDNTSNEQDKLTKILNESQALLNRTKQSIRQSKVFIEKAREYLDNTTWKQSPTES